MDLQSAKNSAEAVLDSSTLYRTKTRLVNKTEAAIYGRSRDRYVESTHKPVYIHNSLLTAQKHCPALLGGHISPKFILLTHYEENQVKN